MSSELMNFPRTEYDEESNKIWFIPPVHDQRYESIYNILINVKWKDNLKKIIDFGCSKLSFFKVLKSLDWLETILCIDVNEATLQLYGQKAQPTFEDNISPRNMAFEVKVYAGNIGEIDSCLLSTDAVVCIEVIEHLYPVDLENVPFTIFGYIQPKLAIFTTPNVEFNVLFGNSTKFRNNDHKFEWTRAQFQDWAHNIIQRYPEYCVEFHDIGPSPKGYEYLGPVTQMAVFSKIASVASSPVISDFTEANCNYKLMYDYVYPIKLDKRSNKQKVLDEVDYHLSIISDPNNNKFKQYCRNKNNELVIPLEELHDKTKMFISSINELKNILVEYGYHINRDYEILKVVQYDYLNKF